MLQCVQRIWSSVSTPSYFHCLSINHRHFLFTKKKQREQRFIGFSHSYLSHVVIIRHRHFFPDLHRDTILSDSLPSYQQISSVHTIPYELMAFDMSSKMNWIATIKEENTPEWNQTIFMEKLFRVLNSYLHEIAYCVFVSLIQRKKCAELMTSNNEICALWIHRPIFANSFYALEKTLYETLFQ